MEEMVWSAESKEEIGIAESLSVCLCVLGGGGGVLEEIKNQER